MQLELQNKGPTIVVNEISELFSTMNNYACHPGLDKMIDALGNFFTFCENILSKSSCIS